jgi:hypothetical protein
MAQAGISANRLELLQIADAVAREKLIDRKIVIAAMEDAIQKAAKSRYGSENDIRCEIDAKTGEKFLLTPTGATYNMPVAFLVRGFFDLDGFGLDRLGRRRRRLRGGALGAAAGHQLLRRVLSD